MINIMFDNGYSLSIPGSNVKKYEGAKISHIEIVGPDGEFYLINYDKILFIETMEDENK